MAIRSLKSGSFSRSTQVGNSIILPGDYESIATVTLNSTASIDFTSIPSTFKHLQLRIIARDAAGFADCIFQMRFNSDTGSNYGYHWLYGTGASAATYQFTATNQLSAGYMAGGAASTNIFGAGIVDILDYTNTNKYKTVKSLIGNDRNGAGTIGLFSGYWASTSAITGITLKSDNGNFTTGTSIALYGIRG